MPGGTGVWTVVLYQNNIFMPVKLAPFADQERIRSSFFMKLHDVPQKAMCVQQWGGKVGVALKTYPLFHVPFRRTPVPNSIFLPNPRSVTVLQSLFTAVCEHP